MDDGKWDGMSFIQVPFYQDLWRTRPLQPMVSACIPMPNWWQGCFTPVFSKHIWILKHHECARVVRIQLHTITYLLYEVVAMQDATNHTRNITHQMHEIPLRSPLRLYHYQPVAACTAGLVAAGFSVFSVSFAASLDGSLALLASSNQQHGQKTASGWTIGSTCTFWGLPNYNGNLQQFSLKQELWAVRMDAEN